MAKKKPRGKPFPKGHKISVGNKGPKGGIASYDAEELAKRKIDNSLVSRYITVNSHLTRLQLEERLVDPNISIFEERIIKSLLGQDSALAFSEMVNRVAGKVAEEHRHGLIKDKYAEWDDGQLRAEAERLAIENRKTLTHIEIEKGLRPAPIEKTTTESAANEVIEVKPTEPGKSS